MPDAGGAPGFDRPGFDQFAPIRIDPPVRLHPDLTGLLAGCLLVYLGLVLTLGALLAGVSLDGVSLDGGPAPDAPRCQVISGTDRHAGPGQGAVYAPVWMVPGLPLCDQIRHTR